MSFAGTSKLSASSATDEKSGTFSFWSCSITVPSGLSRLRRRLGRLSPAVAAIVRRTVSSTVFWSTRGRLPPLRRFCAVSACTGFDGVAAGAAAGFTVAFAAGFPPAFAAGFAAGAAVGFAAGAAASLAAGFAATGAALFFVGSTPFFFPSTGGLGFPAPFVVPVPTTAAFARSRAAFFSFLANSILTASFSFSNSARALAMTSSSIAFM